MRAARRSRGKWELLVARVEHRRRSSCAQPRRRQATLATLAIIVWHLYYVIFNHDAYPMNLVWLTGRISKKEIREHHPLELEQIKADRLAQDEAALRLRKSRMISRRRSGWPHQV